MIYFQNLWSIRERIAEGLLKDGYNYKYDISLPRDQYYNIVDIMRERLGDSVLRVIGYGHLGDGECGSCGSTINSIRKQRALLILCK